MPRDGSGVYTLPAGNPVVTNTVIASTWANGTMSDIAAQLNNVLTRDGLLGPTGPFKLQDGTVAAPGLAWNSEPGLGWYRSSTGVRGFAQAGAAVEVLSSSSSVLTSMSYLPRAAGGSQVTVRNNVGSNYNEMIFGVTTAGGVINLGASGTNGVLPLDIQNSGQSIRLNSLSTQVKPFGASGNASLELYKSGAGTQSVIAGVNAGTGRWYEILGDTAAESGSNAGSNYALQRVSDAGSILGTSFTITRATGDTIFNTNRFTISTLTGGVNPVLVLNQTQASSYATLLLTTVGGSKFMRVSSTNVLEFVNAAAAAIISTLNDTGTWTATAFTPTSDERIKSDIVVLEPSSNFYTIQPISYVRNGDPESGHHYGFSAQNLYAADPVLVVGDLEAEQPAAIDTVGILALAVLEIKTLNDRLTALETA